MIRAWYGHPVKAPVMFTLVMVVRRLLWWPTRPMRRMIDATDPLYDRWGPDNATWVEDEP